MKTFEVKTEPKSGGRFLFYTKGNNGKEALDNLINYSSDYKNLLRKTESNNMTITITWLKGRRKK